MLDEGEMPAREPEKVLEKVRTSELLRIYGGLLSEKQAEILRLYYDEDWGYSEIAEQLGVTRQAVYDATQQGKIALERYEEHLGLLERQRTSDEGSSRSASVAVEGDNPAPEEARRVFAAVEKMAGEDILYDTRRLRLRLRELKQALWPGQADG